MRREISELKNANKTLTRTVRMEQEAFDQVNQDNEKIADQQSIIEELEDERNRMIEETDRLLQQNQEYEILLEQLTIQLSSVQKSEQYLKRANENHQNVRRRLESKILELQQEY